MVGEEFVETREFNLPAMGIISAVYDMIELQHGEVSFSDIPQGMLFFIVEMYGFQWECQFTVTGIGNNRSRVALRIGGEVTRREERINKQLNLLESLLIGGDARQR